MHRLPISLTANVMLGFIAGVLALLTLSFPIGAVLLNCGSCPSDKEVDKELGMSALITGPSAVDQAEKSLQTGILNQLTKLSDSGEKISCREAQSKLEDIVAEEVLKNKDVLQKVSPKEADNIVKYVLQSDQIKEALLEVMDSKGIASKKSTNKPKTSVEEWKKKIPKEIRNLGDILIKTIAKELAIAAAKAIVACVTGEGDNK